MDLLYLLKHDNVTGKRQGLRWVCPARSRMCVLDSVQATFQNMRPGDLESMFSEAKEWPRREETRSPPSSPPRPDWTKSVLGCLVSGEEVTVTEVSHPGQRGLRCQGTEAEGESWQIAPHSCPDGQSPGTLWSLGERKQGENRSAGIPQGSYSLGLLS